MSWITRLKNTVHSSRLDQDVAEELRDHINRRAAQLEAQGLSRSEALRRASQTFGNVTALHEQSRDRKLWPALESALQDTRYAWRGLLRNPIFALTAVLSLSLAIGANTAIYTIVDAVLFRPLPVAQPERLFTLTTPEPVKPGVPAARESGAFSYPLYEQLQAAAGSSAHIALCDTPVRVDAQAGSAGAPYEEAIQQYVSPGALDILGVSPAAGRLFSSAGVRDPSPRAVVVLSYEYWKRRFSANPAVIGQTLILNSRTYSILGVTREGFYGLELGKFVDVWLPIALTRIVPSQTWIDDPGIFTNPEFRIFHLFGRLAPGVTREQIAARLQPAFHRHQEARIDAGTTRLPPALITELRQMQLFVHPGANGISAFGNKFLRPLWILLGVSACLLLIACANVASLLLARSTTRSAEMALRISLGARRARLVRQLLTESLLISFLAGLGGWSLARIAAPALVSLVSQGSDPIHLDLSLDLRILFFCAAVCGLSSVFFGLLPAWQATSARPMFALRHGNSQSSGLRLGRLFVAVQVAFSFCLVTSGAGFLFSLRNLAKVETGFDPVGVTVLNITTDSQQHDRQLAIMQQMRLKVAALPAVQDAATAWMTIFTGARRAQRIVLPGKQPFEREETFYRVSPNYFATLHTPLLSGRDLTVRDNDNEPVPTVVNLAFAHAYFPNESALGREFLRDDGVRHQIVGIAANSHFGDLHSGPESIAYMPMKPPRAFTLYVRSSLDAGSVFKMVQREASSLGAGTRVRSVTTLETLVGNTLLTEKLLASLGGAFAFLGLILAGIGLFGLLNYSVTRRTKEIGIRAALGASRLPLYRLVLTDLLGMMGGGLAAGIAGAFILMRLTRSLMFGIQPADPLPIVTALAIFIGAAAVACSLPARRAASIDPIVALRHE